MLYLRFFKEKSNFKKSQLYDSLGFLCFIFPFPWIFKICCIELTCFSFLFPYRKEKIIIHVPFLTSLLTEDYCETFYCLLDSLF